MPNGLANPATEEEPGGGLSGGQRTVSVLRSLAGVLGSAAYSAGVSGAAQNPWAGPQALAQLRSQGVENKMREMQMAAMAEHKRRQTMMMEHLQKNFSDMSDPNQRQAAIQYLMGQGAFEYAQKASNIFAEQFGDTGELAQKKELETHKSGLAREEAQFDADLEREAAAGAQPDFSDVSKMGTNYGKRGGAVFKDLTWANGRIKAAYDLYKNADPGTENGRSQMAQAYQAMNVALNKLLDPGSVVRESEFARTATYQSLQSKAKSLIEQIKTGAVNPAVMAGIASMGEALFRQGAEQQVPIWEEYERKATRYFGGVGIEDVLGGWEDPREAVAALNEEAGGAGAPGKPSVIGPPNSSTGNAGITITEMER
jgi:hypothetical protein